MQVNNDYSADIRIGTLAIQAERTFRAENARDGTIKLQKTNFHAPTFTADIRERQGTVDQN